MALARLFGDLVTLLPVSLIVITSVFSVAVILHFHIQTRRYRCLRDFNSLWPVRLLLVGFSLLSSSVEALRLLHFPRLTPSQEATLCKIYIVSSQGLFQPAFFITLIFLLKAPLRKHRCNNSLPRALSAVAFSSLPLLLLHTFFVFFSDNVLSWFGDQDPVTEFLRRHSLAAWTDGAGRLVLCTCPIFSAVAVGVFGAFYLSCFLLLCFRTADLVINRSLRVRIYGLASSVIYAVPTQALCLLVSAIWHPEEKAYRLLPFMGFSSLLLCVMVSQGILVIRPIMDALAVGR